MSSLIKGKAHHNPNRNQVLGELVPKVLGIVAQRGCDVAGLGGCAAMIGDDIAASAHRLGLFRIMLGVYCQWRSEPVKVLSLHTTTNTARYFDPDDYKYVDGKVALLSWRRGGWENDIMRDPAPAISIDDAFASDMFDHDRPPASAVAPWIPVSGH
jgi:hypothetical protein